MRKRSLAAGILAVAACLLLAGAAAAGYFTYKDEHGCTHYVDSPDKIPARYRENTEEHLPDYDLGSNPPDVEGGASEAPVEYLAPQDTQDWYRKRLLQERMSRARESGGTQRTRVTTRNDQVIVPVRIRYGSRTAKIHLLLDTGANGTLLYESVARSVGLEPEGQFGAQTAGGHIIRVGMGVLDWIEVGPKSMQEYPVMIVRPAGGRPPGFDGLLGMSFLKRFPHSVDYAKGYIVWKR